jgi:hypothetical protein
MPSNSPSIVLGCDGGLHLVEREHRDQRGELAAADDVAAGGIGVAAVRRFRRIWNATSILPGSSALMNEIVPLKFCLYSLMGTSACGIGTEKRVAPTHVLAVRRDERRGVVAAEFGDLEDLRRLERGEVDAGDARRVVAVDEEPAAVGIAGGLRQRGVVRVIPRDEAEGR